MRGPSEIYCAFRGEASTLGIAAAKVQSDVGCQSGSRAERWIGQMRKSHKVTEHWVIVLPDFRLIRGQVTGSQAGGLQKSHLESRGMRLFQPKSPDKDRHYILTALTGQQKKKKSKWGGGGKALESKCSFNLQCFPFLPSWQKPGRTPYI